MIRRANWHVWAPMTMLALALMLAVGWGYYAAIQNRRYTQQLSQHEQNRALDALARRTQNNEFFEFMCVQDSAQNAVVIRLLRDSNARLRSFGLRGADIIAQNLQAIDMLLRIDRRCIDNVPDNADPP